MYKHVLIFVLLISGCATTTPLTPILVAVDNNNIANVDILLDSGTNIEETGGRYSETPLIMASRLGNLDMVKHLIKRGSDINFITENGDTALIAASINCSHSVIEFLLENGAKVNSQNFHYKSTALNWAASECTNSDTVGLLINNGANLNLANKNNDTPLITAVKARNSAVAKLLVNKGASLSVKNNDGLSALHFAIRFGMNDVAKLLIESGADINSKQDVEVNIFNRGEILHSFGFFTFRFTDEIKEEIKKRGFTVLMEAVKSGNHEIVSLLIDNNVELNTQNEVGKTALDLAKLHDKDDIARILSEAGAK